jgi:TolA-binding protein
MWGIFCRAARKSALLIACLLVLSLSVANAQQTAPPAASPQANSGSSTELHGEVQALSAVILELKSQLKSMNDQMVELRKEQERGREEARELRRRLEMMQAREAASLSRVGNSGELVRRCFCCSTRRDDRSKFQNGGERRASRR